MLVWCRMTEQLHDPVIAAGVWGEDVQWELRASPQTVPPKDCTAVACIAISSLAEQRVVLTRNHRGWEVLCGHIEPGETLLDAMAREALEEGGFAVDQDRAMPFAYRKMTALRRPPAGSRASAYPYPTSYIPYYYALTDRPLTQPTGEEIVECAALTLAEIKQFAAEGKVSDTELTIIRFGLARALQDHGSAQAL